MSSKLFRKTALKIKLEQNFKNVPFDNIEERACFDKLEQFLTRTYIMISPSFHGYLSGHQPFKRVLIVCIIKINAILFILRYMAAIIWDTPYVRTLTSNANHVLGN